MILVNIDDVWYKAQTLYPGNLNYIIKEEARIVVDTSNWTFIKYDESLLRHGPKPLPAKDAIIMDLWMNMDKIEYIDTAKMIDQLYFP